MAAVNFPNSPTDGETFTYEGKTFQWSAANGIWVSKPNGPVANISGKTYEYTATASQTVFSGTDDNGETLLYAVDNILVHRNGILIVSTVDYVATDGTSVVLQSPADSGDTISIVAYHVAYQPTLVGAGGSDTLDDLTDTDLAGASNGDYLAYNSTTSKWEPTSASAGTNTSTVYAYSILFGA